ncbi:hypothetical protein [Arsukibacterium sp.]|uniref:hypothetical protein n=1 Tax=Arsukibacterium sp. TaxID=1977258 RepID=UPI002FD9FB7A
MTKHLIIIASALLLLIGCAKKDPECEHLQLLAQDEAILSSLTLWVNSLDRNPEIRDILTKRTGTIYANERTDYFGLPVNDLNISTQYWLAFGFYDKAALDENKSIAESGFLYIGYGRRKHLLLQLRTDADVFKTKELASAHSNLVKVSNGVYLDCRP